MLERVAEGLWVASSPLTLLGIHLGTRMTVVRLHTGGLLLHSPIRIDPSLKAEIDQLGSVTHIVCPNLYHHLFAGEARQLWPDAHLHGPEKLLRKRRDLRLDASLSESEPHPDWQNLQLLTIGGCTLGETVFLHKDSGTLITSDLIENFTTSPHFFTRCYLKIAGVHGKPGWSRLLRWMYRDRKTARADIGRMLHWDFDRLILAHGNMIHADAQSKIREGMAWLLEP